MVSPNNPPQPYRLQRNVASVIGLIAIGCQSFVSVPSWLQVTLNVVAITCFACAALLEVQNHKAEEAWRESQPGFFDPLKGSPPIPKGENIGNAVGIAAFFALLYFWNAHKDTGLQGSDWWMFSLLPIAVGALSYASWCKKKHFRAVEQWKMTKSGPASL